MAGAGLPGEHGASLPGARGVRQHRKAFDPVQRAVRPGRRHHTGAVCGCQAERGHDRTRGCEHRLARVHISCPPRDRAPVKVVAAVYSGSQPYHILEQVVVGNTQVFTPTRLIPPPLPVAGLGLMADWFPQYPNLEATDGYRLVAVTVAWDRAPQRELRSVAMAVTRPYTHPPAGQTAIDKLLYGEPPG